VPHRGPFLIVSGPSPSSFCRVRPGEPNLQARHVLAPPHTRVRTAGTKRLWMRLFPRPTSRLALPRPDGRGLFTSVNEEFSTCRHGGQSRAGP
jgi:hypothetical protein